MIIGEEEKLSLEELHKLGTFDLGESAKKHIHPTIQFTLEEYQAIEKYSEYRRFKKGTIIQMAIRAFIGKKRN